LAPPFLKVVKVVMKVWLHLFKGGKSSYEGLAPPFKGGKSSYEGLAPPF